MTKNTIKTRLIMIEQDTIKLLRECDAGIKMGISSINDVLSSVKSDRFYNKLNECKGEHQKLADELLSLLEKYEDDGKRANPILKGMAKMKTEMKLAMHKNDKTIADLITDGCNMGVKSLNRYLNQYEAADEVSKDIAKRLIHLEESLCRSAAEYL